MWFALKAVARCQTATFRNSLRTQYHQVGDPIPLPDKIDLADNDDDGRARWVLVERYLTALERDVLVERLKVSFADSRVLDGSRVHLHRCGHDTTPPERCLVGGLWVKQGGLLDRLI